jgi:hypothetical protein
MTLRSRNNIYINNSIINIFIQLYKEDILSNHTFLVKTLMSLNPVLLSVAWVIMIESDYNLIRQLPC